MSMWRCPHCGTPQAETARCWVCRRSSTTCSTCRHFRRSVAAQLGYCGLDQRRLPLRGTELRGCWEPGPVRAHDALPVAGLDIDADEQSSGPPASAPPATPTSPAARLRDFVPVELRGHRIGPARPAAARVAPATDRATVAAASVRPPTVADEAADLNRATGPPWSDRVTLFADAEL